MPNGTAQEWERDWREGVNIKLDRLITVVEGLGTRLSVVENGQKDMRERPENARNWSMLWLMVGGLAVSALCGGGGLVISVINLIAAHWH